MNGHTSVFVERMLHRRLSELVGEGHRIGRVRPHLSESDRGPSLDQRARERANRRRGMAGPDDQVEIVGSHGAGAEKFQRAHRQELLETPRTPRERRERD
jgi:hypothetical protein